MNTSILNDDKRREETVRCPFCQRRFETPNELTLHIVTRHTQSGIPRGTSSPTDTSTK